MNAYYSQSPYGQDDVRRMNQQSGGNDMMGMMGTDQMAGGQMSGAQTLDDVVDQNAKEMRRRSMPMSYGNGDGLDSSMRRVSMIEFGGTQSNGPLNSFQFDPSAVTNLDTTMSDLSAQFDNSSRRKRPAANHLSINTQFQPGTMYGRMGPPASAYASPLAVSSSLDMDMNSPYITSGIPLTMDMNMFGNDMASMDMFASGQAYDSPMIGSPMHANYADSMMGPSQDPGGGGGNIEADLEQKRARSSENSSATPDLRESTSRTNSHENSQPPSSRTTSNSTIPIKRNQMLNMPPPLSTNNSYSPQPPPRQSVAPPPATAAQEMIGGQLLPWTTPAGRIEDRLNQELIEY
jgi:hypothetical protein